jgi:hypothetical protein
MTVIEHSSVQRIRQEEHGTLQDLTAELLRLAETKADYIVDTRRMTFHTGTAAEMEGDVIVEGPPASWLTFDTQDHDGVSGGIVNEYAHRQIRERLGIPAKYYDRMRATEHAHRLLDMNVQHWLLKTPETRMVRMIDGRVRAFLSNRYRRLDNDELLAHAVVPVFQEFGEDRLRFHVAALTDERLYIRAVLPELSADIELDPTNHAIGPEGGGDVVQAGVEIRNSEVGAGALSVTPFIWRLRCLNGLVISDRSLSRYHVGREQEESAYAIYRDDTLAADDTAFFMKVRDAVGAALSDVTFGEIVRSMCEARTGVTIDNPVSATETLAKRIDLSESEAASVLRHLATGGDLTQWGMVNAVTAAAKDAEGFDRQAEMERLGGALVAMPEREWAAIAR